MESERQGNQASNRGRKISMPTSKIVLQNPNKPKPMNMFMNERQQPSVKISLRSAAMSTVAKLNNEQVSLARVLNSPNRKSLKRSCSQTA